MMPFGTLDLGCCYFDLSEGTCSSFHHYLCTKCKCQHNEKKEQTLSIIMKPLWLWENSERVSEKPRDLWITL